MDYGREARYSGGDVVQVLTGPQSKNVPENWAVWATEEDYGPNNGEGSDSNLSYDGKQSQTRSESEPPNKKSRTPPSGDSRSKAIGKMFFKTKLCCKFRAGSCPYITNCNFAHSIEELRRPPPNWQDIVAGANPEPVEEFQIPTLGSPGFNGDSQRSFKGRRCKKFYSEEGCPYGEDCTFLHDEYSKDRESVAISLGPNSGGSYGNSANGANAKPSNWKTRICNKWELTGYCPFGSKCHFAHGVEELHRFGGGPAEGEARDSPNAPLDVKHESAVVAAAATTVPQSDAYAGGIPSQRLSNVIQRSGQRLHEKWKGPDKISRIYGDWIDDFE